MAKTKYLKVPVKYLPPQLTRKDRKKALRGLLKARRSYKKDKYIDRPKLRSYRSRPSKHVRNAKAIYKVDVIKPTKILAKKTGCNIKALRDIVKKGEGAYYSSGSRPNQTAQSWGYARLGSAITGAKSAAIDWHIIRHGCKKSGKAYKLAKKALKKYGKGTRRVPKTKAKL